MLRQLRKICGRIVSIDCNEPKSFEKEEGRLLTREIADYTYSSTTGSGRTITEYFENVSTKLPFRWLTVVSPYVNEWNYDK